MRPICSACSASTFDAIALGLQKFLARYPGAKPLVVGTGGVPLETFFASSPLAVLG